MAMARLEAFVTYLIVCALVVCAFGAIPMAIHTDNTMWLFGLFAWVALL